MPESILLFGAGGHAKTCIDVIEAAGVYSIVGLVTPSQTEEQSLFGYPIIGSDNDLSIIRTYSSNAFIAFGHFGNVIRRKSLISKLSIYNFNFPTIISPSSYVSKRAALGEGILISHNSVINASASIGDFCIINSLALIEHDSVVCDHSHVSTSAIINGNCIIGADSFIGSGSIIREGIALPPSTIVSAGKRIMGWSSDSTVSL